MKMVKLDTASALAMYSTSRLEVLRADGSTAVGTSFFFRFQIQGDRTLDAIITNKHVIAGGEEFIFLFHAAEPRPGGDAAPSAESFAVRVHSFKDCWISHPAGIDLCAIPLQFLRDKAESQGRTIFAAVFEEAQIPDPSFYEQVFAVEDVVMVGYPVGLWDEANNLPVFRRGITASHPAVDFNSQPCGLVDIAAFPGSSGSPVLILNEGGYAIRGGMCTGNRVALLGVLFAGFEFTADGRIETVEIPTATVPVARTDVPIHLGCYAKSRALMELKEHLFAVLGIR